MTSTAGGENSKTSVPRGIDARAVSGWYQEHIEGTELPLGFEVIVGGHSNLTYKVTDAASRATVLRRPPLGAVLATAHDMEREHRILSGVGKSDVPVPVVLGLCEDEAVNGAPFYVMDYVQGHVLDTAGKVEERIPSLAARHALGLDTADVLARLHTVDPDGIGLGKLGRKEAYLDRQIKRWRKQWEASKTRELDAMEQSYDLLLKHKPEQRYTGIVHGDYRLGNMLATETGAVAAVLDWELCTLGNVLADVGYLLNNWLEEAEKQSGFTALPPTAAGGFPTREQWLERYVANTGFEIGHVEYYQAFQHWRLAAIVEGVMARYLKGVMADQEFDADAYRLRIDWMAEQALTMLQRL
jgi:aminoglycoside phosphotransferase (APT) family kinase protein